MDNLTKGLNKTPTTSTKLKYAKIFLNSVHAHTASGVSSCTKKTPMKDKNNTTEKNCRKSIKILNSFSWTKSNSLTTLYRRLSFLRLI
jgi:hypothetical protein